MRSLSVPMLFLDVGGVLLTNAWERAARSKVAEQFGIDPAELEARHQEVVDPFERGRLDLEGYLSQVVFYTQRPFSREAFRNTMFAQSTAHPQMIGLVRNLRSHNRLKVAVVSNESRELAEYRIREFELGTFVDFFVVSSFVQLRKPERAIYRLALDLAQITAEQVAYVEDRPEFVEAAARLGLHAIHHVSVESTQEALGALGISPSA